MKTGNVANDIYIEEETKHQKAYEEVKAAKEEKIAARQAQIDATTDLLADTEEVTNTTQGPESCRPIVPRTRSSSRRRRQAVHAGRGGGALPIFPAWRSTT